MTEVTVKKGSIVDVVKLSMQIPEFHQPHQENEYRLRLEDTPHLIAIAFSKNAAVGFKVGYQRENDGSFYSWMGGILPDFRRKGVARLLADYQENWARQQGYHTIKMKTRNRLKPMLYFALGNGFNIVKVDQRESVEENRIHLEKQL
ncbi:GNAT family N-acetyltransferase [Fulvivirgaceae bacterium BMA12]|uniref:GNAT family N-acetyltransferase n=1 Tax=Agaribacillus aureus TaxID=3051825 RepID=A0ABT8LFT0_9BACT|nr:GNAT family N-acetyltransferase [Fulvivirgaceae bacterium BMA12]